MPEFHYWITPAAAFLLGSFLITVILGIIGIKNLVPRKTIFSLLGASFIVMLSGLWMAAKQEKESATNTDTLNTIAAYMKIGSGHSAAELADQILKGLPPKYPLTDEQTEKLSTVLNGTPQNERFHVDIFWPQLNGNRNHAETVAKIFSDAHWDTSVRMAALVNGHGIIFAVPKDVADRKAALPIDAIKLIALLVRANISYAIGGLDNVPDGTFAFIVGEPEK